MKHRILETFRDRSSEWILSIALAGWGIATLLSTGLFNDQEFFHPMLVVMSQTTWGALATIVGLIRITFLIINGAWRPSAHIRAIGCIFGCLTWGMLFLSTFELSWLTPTTELYAALLSLDLLALWFAAGDAKVADIEAKERQI